MPDVTPEKPGPLSDDEARARFTALFEATYRDVLVYALRRTRDRADADDVVADTYLVAWRRLDDVLAADSPVAWLYGVAYRTLANRQRARRRATALDERLQSQAAPLALDDVSVAAVTHERLAGVLRALDSLEARDQEVLRLAAFEGLTPSEIAVVIDASPALTRTYLYRARRRLRRALDTLRPPGSTGEAP